MIFNLDLKDIEITPDNKNSAKFKIKDSSHFKKRLDG